MGEGNDEDRRSAQAFPFEKKVTDYSRHNMSRDCIITLWTIDVTVTGEIAISASSMMDFSMIVKMVKGPSSLISRD